MEPDEGISHPVPFFILKRLVEAYPTVTDSPVKVLTSNKIKNAR